MQNGNGIEEHSKTNPSNGQVDSNDDDSALDHLEMASKLVEQVAYWSARNSLRSRATPLMLLSQELQREHGRLVLDLNSAD